MKKQQFDKQRFGIGMGAICDGDNKVYDIVAVDFEERLVGLGKDNAPHEDVYWANCENVTLV